ncbi:MAG: hypothetical protein AAB731_04325 [Patescibacteria group bacterium]
MRRIGLVFTFLILSSGAEAKTGWELELIVGFDAKLIAGRFQGNDALTAARLRHRNSLLALEINSPLAHGFGANLLIDTIRAWRFRGYLNCGIFWPIAKNMSVPEISRSYDLVFGAGVEYALRPKLAIILDWRAYIPDPRLMVYYGEFFIPMYKQSLKEGAWWLGLGWRL